MRVLKCTLFVFMVFGFYAAKAQLPIAYYDFEDNSARNTTIETTLETAVSTIGTPTVTDANGLTSSNGVGNGAGYGGSNTGYALGYYGFTTGAGAPTAAASDALPHIIFGPFTTTGLATLTLTMDLMGIGDKRPGNAVIYWSTDNVTYTRVATYPTVGTSFATESFTLPAGASNQASLYIRVLGYNPSNTGTPDGTNGVMKIDNFTLRSSQINAPLTLANASTHGVGLTSGDTYLPTYASFFLNSGTGNDVTMASELSLTGYVDLTSGNLVVGANTLTFQVQTGTGSSGPIRKSGADAGFIVLGTSSNMVIGDGTETLTTTLPNNAFSAPSGMGDLTINRNTAQINWGNNPMQITGDLNISSGVFIINNASGTIDVDGNANISNIGELRDAAANALNVDGNVEITDDGVLRVTANSANAAIGGSLNINNNGQAILSGTNSGVNISLGITANLQIGSAATLDLANNTTIVEVTGNVTGSGTISSAASNRRIVILGATSTLSSSISYGNIEINSAGTVSLTGSTVVTGYIRLTNGTLAVGSNTLSLTAPAVVPIQRNGGSQVGLLSMGASSTLELGDGTQTTGYTLPNSFFTTPTNFSVLTLNRSGGTVNWGNNPITLASNLNITAGSGGIFVINNATGTINVGGNLNVNDGTFRISVATDIPVTGNLNLFGDLSLTNASANLVVTGNVTGSGTHVAASTGQLVMVGNGSTLSNTIIYDNLNINSVGGTVNLTGSTTIGGTLRLTDGILAVGSNTITFTYNGTPILRNGGTETGTLSMGATSTFAYGNGSQTATVTMPNSFFTTPTSFATLAIDRTSGTMNWGNNPITLSGNANIDAGTGTFILNNVAGTLDVGGNLNINSGEFRVSVGSNNTVTGNLNILGTLGLTAATAYVTVSGNVIGTGSQTLASTGRIVMVGTGANTLASTVTYDDVEINTASGISLTGSTTFTGTLRLTNGNLNVGANTITFHTSNTPLATTSGSLNLTSTSSLRFGNAGNMAGNNFTIPNNVFTGTDIEFANFYINRTNRIVLNNQNFAISGFLGIEGGQLALPAGYLFTLRSTSITNTAMVSEVGATGVITYGTGAAFRVERFIPQTGGTGVRAYRDFAPSVNSGTGTIYTNWQEGGTNGLDNGVYYGTHITGFVGASGIDAGTGFDKTYSGSGSLSTFDISTVNGSGTWYTWSSATSRSTNQANDTLSAFKGYRVLIRGNRLVDLTQNPTPTTMNAPATLRSIGKLVYGDVVFNTSGVTANGGTNTGIRLNSFTSSGYTMVGNPYACPIDWELVHADVGTTNLSSTYYVFDPNLSTSGAYATYNATSHTTAPVASDANQYIQPGQAFFVRNSGGSSPTLTIRESHKAASSLNLTNTFKASSDSLTISKIYINLNKEVSVSNYKLADGVAVVFNNTFSNGDGPEDASKISNNLENLSIISKNNKQWIIEGRQQAYANDSVQLRMYYGANAPIGGNYNLEINMDHFINNGLQAYLYDSYTNTLTTLAMAGISTYNYTVTNVAATYNLRFVLVFKPNNVLPVSFITVNAEKQNNDIAVNWTVAESNIATYQVQKSSNAMEFATIGTLVAKGNSNATTQKYNWMDTKPFNGNNYYRINAIGKDGKITNSSIVLIKMTDKNTITVYPNPVKDRRLNILTESLAKGNYEIQFYNIEGKSVYNYSLKHLGGNATFVVNLPISVTSGMYQMVIKGKDYNNSQNIIVE
jgi:hypothetical protein